MWVICSMPLEEICKQYVLPLPGCTQSRKHMRRWADEPHMQAMACALGVGLNLHDVSGQQYCAVHKGEPNSGITIDLMFYSAHYEPLYRSPA